MYDHILAQHAAELEAIERRAYELRRIINKFRFDAEQARRHAMEFDDENRDLWLRYANWCDSEADRRES